MTERRADEATRDVVDWLKCEYMMAHVGSDFDGIVTTVTGFGLFVELQDIYVEGLVHVTELANDYYHFDPVGHRLTGERSGMSYRVGDAIRVSVARVDLDERKIDFVLAAGNKGGKAKPAKVKTAKAKAGKVRSGEKKSAARRSGGSKDVKGRTAKKTRVASKSNRGADKKVDKKKKRRRSGKS